MAVDVVDLRVGFDAAVDADVEVLRSCVGVCVCWGTFLCVQFLFVCILLFLRLMNLRAFTLMHLITFMLMCVCACARCI